MDMAGARTTTVCSLVGVYQQAVRKLLTARQRVDAWVQLIAKAGMVLDGDKWRTVATSESGVAPGGLRSVTDGGFELAVLPSGRELVAGLAEWRQAWDLVNRAWQALPKEHQVGLKEPKDLY